MVARPQCNIHSTVQIPLKQVMLFCDTYTKFLQRKSYQKLRCSYLVHHFHTEDNFLINKKVSSNTLNCMNHGTTQLTDAEERLDSIGARLAIYPRKCLCDYHEVQQNCCICTNTRKLWFMYPATQFAK